MDVFCTLRYIDQSRKSGLQSLRGFSSQRRSDARIEGVELHLAETNSDLAKLKRWYA